MAYACNLKTIIRKKERSKKGKNEKERWRESGRKKGKGREGGEGRGRDFNLLLFSVILGAKVRELKILFSRVVYVLCK